MDEPMTHGPLHGVRILEFAGLGPTPFAAMTLCDMGAEVVRIERPGAVPLIPQDVDYLNRGRGFVTIDLKSPDGIAAARALAGQADGLIEGMRPGTMERLGLGPDELLTINPRLVYGRMTGWGQNGPRAQTAGHDINYIGLTGMLHAIGGEHPVVPLNLLGDFGGGGIYLAYGLVCALFHSQRSGQGQVVDAAITDGVSHMATMIHSLYRSGQWKDRRQSNLLDGAAPFYTIYQCACGAYLAVGAIESKFWEELLSRLNLTDMPPQMSTRDWPMMRTRLATTFSTQTRNHWTQIFDGTDSCVTPVLTIEEANRDAHLSARGTFTEYGPEVAPRLNVTPGQIGPKRDAGPMDVAAVLNAWS